MSRIILCLTIVLSAVFTVAVNQLAAEPDEMQEDGQIIQQNVTLPQNVTRILQLQVNFTNEEYDLDALHKLGFYISTLIKSDRYTAIMQFPISDFLVENPILTIPIINDEDHTDDGGDFRVDVSINQFDDKFEKVTYPISKNATFGSVNIDDMLRYVIEDEKKEGNYIDDDDSDDSETEAEYS
jgi:hypothetical protein